MATNKPDDPEDQDDDPGPSSSKIPRLEHQMKVDRKKEIHYDLIAELKGEIYIKWDGYDNLLERLRPYGFTSKEIEYCKADCKGGESYLFDYLECKGIIEEGTYDVLLKLLDKKNERAIKIIRTYQAKFEEISRKEEDSRQKPDDQPRSRCSNIEKTMHEKQATLSQELKVIEKRTLKRLEGQLSSNTFVQTQAVTKGKQILDENRILIYTGLPGEGKTENALFVLNLLRQESTNNIYLKLDSLSEWKYVDPDLNLIILLDDCFGKTNANSNVINDNEKWREIEACMKEGKVRLILTIRKHIFVNNCTKLENSGTELFMKKNVIDLSTKDFRLTRKNKKDMLEKHCQSKSIEICKNSSNENLTLADQAENNLKISQYTLDEIVETDCAIGFPYTCYLFFSHPKYTKQGTKFFEKPLEHLKIDISELVSINSGDLEKTQYCLMCYMMLKGGDINLKDLDQDMLDNIIKSVGVKMPLEREKKEAIENLNHMYVVGEYPTFSFKHQTILECVALCFADDNIKLLLQLCSNGFISEFIRPADYKKKDGEEIIMLDPNDYILVVQRLISLLKDKKAKYMYYSLEHQWWTRHPLLGDKQFVELYFNEIKGNRLCKYIKRLCVISAYQNCPFVNACKFGYTYFIEKLYNDLHVQMSYIDTGTALEEACKGGHTETVMWLLNSEFRIHKVIGAMGFAPTETLTSMITHQNITMVQIKKALADGNCCIGIGRHCDDKTVEVLFNRWPNIGLEYVLKLFNACIEHGNDSAYRFILTTKSDVMQPYISDSIKIASFKGSVKFLKAIVEKMPHVITQQILIESFTSACAGGHVKIVDYLLGLKNKDIEEKSIYLSHNDMHITHLHVSAYFGNFEILKKLTAMDVDVNCKSKTNKSALSYAIEGYAKEHFNIRDGKQNNEIINHLSNILKYENDLMFCGNSDYTKVFDHLIQLDGINLTDLDIILDKQCLTLAHHLTLKRNIDTIELILSKYKKVMFSETSCRMTCLHIAAFMDSFDIFEMLVEAGLSMKDRDKSDRSVLHYAIMGYKYSYGRYIEDSESFLSFYFEDNFPFKCFSQAEDRPDIMTYILQSSDVGLEELNILDNCGMALVHYCVLFNHVETLQLLINCDEKSVFCRTKEGLTCLHIAAFSGSFRVFQVLVNSGLSIKDRDKSNRSILQYAIMGYKNLYFREEKDEEVDKLLFYLKQHVRNSVYLNRVIYHLKYILPILTLILQSSDVSLKELNILDNCGMALVHYCVLFNDVVTLQILISCDEKSVFFRTKEGQTCLHIAAFSGSFDVFKVLVNRGLSIKDRDKSNRSILQYAIISYKYHYIREDKDEEVDKSLFYLKQHVNYNVYLDRRVNHLKYILPILTHILQSSDVSLKDLDILDNCGMAPIHYCVLFNDEGTLQLLISCNEKLVFCRTKEGQTCLHIAAFSGSCDAFEVLVNRGLSIKDRDKSNRSILQYAIMSYKYHYVREDKDVEIDKSLFDLKQHVNYNVYLERIINHLFNILPILTHILQNSDISLEELNILDNCGMALVHYCVLFNDVETLQLLISCDEKSVFCRTKEGQTCLHIAAFSGSYDVYELLVKRGLSIKDRDRSGRNVLQYATIGYKFKYAYKDMEVDKSPLFLKYVKDHFYEKCHRDCFENFLPILTHILQSSDVSLKELDILDNNGMALVHYCVLVNDVETIQLLISCDKRSVFCRTKEGLTCLHIALSCENSNMFEVLVEAGLSTKELDNLI